MSKEVSGSDRAVRVVEFLKAIGSNPERKIDDVARDYQISRSSAYNYLNDFGTS